MSHFQITFPGVTTDICIGSGSSLGLPELFAKAALDSRATLLITDHTVARLHLADVMARLRPTGLIPKVHEIEPGEESKGQAEMERVYNSLASAGIGRDGLLIALGGGVVSDLAGFAAATWMRGVDWMAIPTTMEAMVDACVGGKTAINTPSGKNLVGAFYVPKAIYIEPKYLATLPPRDLRAGLAESIKHALLFDEAFLIAHEQESAAILRMDPEVTHNLIQRNIHLKADVVRRDPVERTGERIVLNFGHTIGHALEAACHFALRHGECVALGMLAECRMAKRRGMLNGEVVQRVQALLAQFGLPTRLELDLDIDAVLAYLRQDKKARAGQARFVLLRGIGQPEIVNDVTETEIREAVATIL